ncbi:poly synthetase 2 [Thecamonas trahens ATCC 50062]|uniref:Poly [ADP-ribose] polymerase n=1 Tax=Thecamonas trahens ATCC 50062 TaxID=461836 RepID=A0A0L0DG58_THETB|nr:poly synthetase 2 [Thecamonas trahens ATCC 50062]KNC51314.1 poly synthetase 2 [Thecamonas trahens ATCC 50062]|eukprot:XP_013756236.1 poly synthetase 2 [Thecamonas trahens ATCC 50062]
MALAGVTVCVASAKYAGLGPRQDAAAAVEAAGGTATFVCTADVDYVMAVPDDVAKDSKKIRKATALSVPVVSEDWLAAAVAAGALVDWSPHSLKETGATASGPAAATLATAGPGRLAAAASATASTVLEDCCLFLHAPRGESFADDKAALSAAAEALGAEVVKRFSAARVSHVVLPDGVEPPPKFQSVTSAFVVTEAWLAAAVTGGKRADEADFEATGVAAQSRGARQKRKRQPSPPAAPASAALPTSIAGLCLCLTGRFSTVRNKLEKQIAATGASVVTSVSSSVDYLVTANPGSNTVKEQTALSLGVPVVPASWLEGLLAGKPVAAAAATAMVPVPPPKRAKPLTAAATAGGSGDDDQDDGPSCGLPLSVQAVVEMICDLNSTTSRVMSMDYDANKLPLGKLKKSHVRKGRAKLKEIEDELNGPGRRHVLTDLSSNFYTLVPHVFGMRRPPVIDSIDMLKTKIQLMDALSDIQATTKSLKSVATSSGLHPITARYNMLQTTMAPVAPGSDVDTMIRMYAKNTHAPTHKRYSLEVLDILEVERAGASARYAPHGALANRTLLWHGTRMSNMVGILRQAPVTGYMFGKGIYGTDMVSKAAQYCWATKTADVGLLVLAEFALGTSYKARAAEPLDGPPPGTHSTHGEGKTRTNPKHVFKMSNGVRVPLGKPVPARLDTDSSLLYDEFVVYDESQVIIRYLVKVRFSFK